MAHIELTEHEIQALCPAIRRGVKRLLSDIRHLETQYGDQVMPEILEGKQRKIQDLRNVAEKFRFQLDI